MKKFKRLSCFLAAALIAALMCVPAFAANHITEIAVNVVIGGDGSAHITQTWNGSFDEGTECYFPVTELNGVSIENLRVSDKTGEYETISWDTGASFGEKAQKCGLLPVEGGYEVCWGLSRYGSSQYTVEYDLIGLVGGYDDYDGFNFQFIPTKMNGRPTDVTLDITMADGTALNADNAAVWAFGFGGAASFENGGIAAYTEEPLRKDSDSVIIMLRLNKGAVTPLHSVGGEFKEVENAAMKGSDYRKSIWEVLIPAIIFGAIIIAAVIILTAEPRRVRKMYKGADYSRDIPLDGNMCAAFEMGREFNQSNDDGNFMAAAFLKLIMSGCLEHITERGKNFFGQDKEKPALRLVKEPGQEAEYILTKLYRLLERACGADGVLQEKELSKYCEHNHDAVLDIVESAKSAGKNYVIEKGCYRLPVNLMNRVKKLTPVGTKYLLGLMGFKKYLLEFSLINERETDAAVIWGDYLVYAALIGIADKVLEQLKKLYPEPTEMMQGTMLAYYTALNYQRFSYTAAFNARSREQARASGGGGASSFGGGGGFSGGGSGGGTR